MVDNPNMRLTTSVTKMSLNAEVSLNAPSVDHLPGIYRFGLGIPVTFNLDTEKGKRPHRVEMRLVPMVHNGELRVLLLGKKDQFCPSVLNSLTVYVGLDNPPRLEKDKKEKTTTLRQKMKLLRCKNFDHETPIVDSRGYRWLPICGRELIGHFWLYFGDFKPDLYNLKPLGLNFSVSVRYFQNEITNECLSEAESSGNDPASKGLLDSLELAQTIRDLQDFILMCDGKRIPCSKFVLAAQSDVFRAMFAQDGLSEAQTNIAVIDDVTPEALEVFVNLLYSPRQHLSYDTAKFVFKLAHRYQVKHIQDYAAKAIHFALEIENCIEIAIIADLYEDQDLLEDALKMIKANLQEIKTSSSWRTFVEKHSRLITKMLTDAS